MIPSWSSLGQTLAVTIATTLGTGILALPVSVYQSGIGPFLVTFTLTFLLQIAIIYASTDLLQHAFYISSKRVSWKNRQINQENVAEDGNETSIESVPLSTTITTQQSENEQPNYPSLFMLAEYFIPTTGLRWMFNLFVISHFILLLVTFALATPQAYVAIFPILSSVPIFMQTTIFVGIISIVVYTMMRLLLPILSIATVFKGSLLIIVVLMTLNRGLTINRTSVSDWSLPTFIDPFLMGTMALSGVFNLIPVTFQVCIESITANQSITLSPTAVVDRSFLVAYRGAMIIGVIFCYVLNVLWVYAVLLVVPQSADSPSLPINSPLFGAVPNATLESAYYFGEISTIPLMKVLKASGNQSNILVASMINAFIAISLTITTMLISVGMLHFLNGFAFDHRDIDEEQRVYGSIRTSGDSSAVDGDSDGRMRWISRMLNSTRILCCIGCVAAVYIVAGLNPEGLLTVMEGFSSLTINIETGTFVAYMLYVSGSMRENIEEPHLKSALMPKWLVAVIITFISVVSSTAIIVDGVFYLPKVLLGR